MITRLFLLLVLFGTIPLWSQVEPSATGGSDDDQTMDVPPPVSGEAFPTEGRADARSNYLRAGLNFGISYDDNVFASGSAGPVSDITYSIVPRIALDQRTPRQRRSVSYGAGVTIYDPTSALNSVRQNAALNYMYRLSPRTTITMGDSFLQSSNAFNQTNLGSGEPISGSTEAPTLAVIAPYASQFANSGNVDLNYQFGKNGMIGGSGFTSFLYFPDLTQVQGLYSFISEGASGFFSQRLTRAHYVGGSYGYSKYTTLQYSSTTETHTISMFYTFMLSHTLSLSVSGGPQYYNASIANGPSSDQWVPAVTASMNWRGEHSAFNARYSRSVYGGGGMLGTYQSNAAGASWRWQMERNWSVSSSVGYILSKNVTAQQVASFPGHSVVGAAGLQHRIGERLSADLGYARLHQIYNGIAAISTAPDSDRISGSISYQLSRPLGR